MEKAKEIIIEIDGERHKLIKKTKRSGDVCKICSLEKFCKYPFCTPFERCFGIHYGSYFKKIKTEINSPK